MSKKTLTLEFPILVPNDYEKADELEKLIHDLLFRVSEECHTPEAIMAIADTIFSYMAYMTATAYKENGEHKKILRSMFARDAVARAHKLDRLYDAEAREHAPDKKDNPSMPIFFGKEMDVNLH